MATLKDFLPAPTDGLTAPDDETFEAFKTVTVVAAPTVPAAGVSNVITLKATGTEDPDYSAIIRQGENATRTVHTRYNAMVEKPSSEVLRPMPSEADVAETTRQTKAALEGVVSTKLNNSTSTQRREKPKFIRYTPANANATSQQRVIKMVEAPRDPMEPPRFAHRKAPVNPPSPPVPVMHSPERKLSKEEAAEWKIPPVVSDWKNNRGYTISLDKRLAADGRSMVDRSVNDRFAHMAEALYQAEKTARAEVEKRATLQRQVSVRAKAARERELRQLAEKARKERREFLGLSERTDTESIAGVRSEGFNRAEEESCRGGETQIEDDAPPTIPETQENGSERARAIPRRRPSRFGNRSDIEATKPAVSGTVDTSEVIAEDVRRRDEIRRQRRVERERELRLREVHGNDSGRATLKRSKLTRDQDRDISEQAALGQSVQKAARGEVLYDERLFNQDGGGVSGRGTSALGGGYGADDSYNLYEQPLFKGSSMSARNLHVRGDKSGRQDESEEKKVTATEPTERGRARDGPVEFERDVSARTVAKENVGDDPYGLNKILEDAEKYR